jgi:hypothetical protein
MKVFEEQPKPAVWPIVITLETQGEIDAMYAMLNWTANIDAIGRGPWLNLFDVLHQRRGAGADQIWEKIKQMSKARA